ncbi:MAG: MATE family efflux transporter [Planctomycetaceae bacterium]|jgi:putative MATE family efflux protein|nr:MATE family efflux transporter [Planctomycetaceae bacterium]
MTINREEQAKFMGEQPVGRLLVRFSIPAVTGMFVNASYGVIDSVFVANVFGRDGLTAVSLTLPIMMIMLSAGMMIGIGTSTLLSIRIGQNRMDEAERLLGTAFFLFFLITVLFMTFGLIFIEPLLRFFGATPLIMPLAKRFLRIIICGTIFMQISFGVNSFLRGEGKVHVAMITLILSAVVNILFSWFFLFVLKTGIEGPAIANLIAQGASSVWIAWYYLSGRTLLRWRLKYVRFDVPQVKQICAMGLAPCFMNVANCIVVAIINNQFNRYGTERWSGEDGIAVMRICQSIFMLVFSVILGISQGGQPVVGYNTGAKKYDRVARTLLLMLTFTIILNTVYTLFVLIFPHLVSSPFLIKNPNLTPLTIRAIRIFMLLFPCVGIAVITANYFQATGRAYAALAITLIRQIVFLIPLYWILPYYWGFDGIWIASPITDGIAAILCMTLLVQEFRRFRTLNIRNEGS